MRQVARQAVALHCCSHCQEPYPKNEETDGLRSFPKDGWCFCEIRVEWLELVAVFCPRCMVKLDFHRLMEGAYEQLRKLNAKASESEQSQER